MPQLRRERGSAVEQILADFKPQAAWFLADDNGQRSASI